MNYSEMQNRFKARIGDRVKIIYKPASYEIEIWGNSWNNEKMDPTIGLIGTILDIIWTQGIFVSIPGHPGPILQKGCWVYPYFSLSIVR